MKKFELESFKSLQGPQVRLRSFLRGHLKKNINFEIINFKTEFLRSLLEW